MNTENHQHTATNKARERGRFADSPNEIPLRGWWDILRRVASEISNDRVPLVAAGVGFFSLLAAVPALAILVSLAGVVLEPQTLVALLDSVSGVPEAVKTTLLSTLDQAKNQSRQDLGWTAVVGSLAALWSAKKGSVAVMQATNIAYEEHDARSWWRSLALSLAFTLGAITLLLLVLVFAIALPLWIREVVDTPAISILLVALQCILLWISGALAIAVLFRFAPDRDAPAWRWLTPGAAIATTLWMAGSLLFGWYAASATSFEDTYGSLAGVVITMLWLYMTGYVVVLGAEFNAEIEHQTRRDTTHGPDEPLGQRGAYVADHVADDDEPESDGQDAPHRGRT